MPTQAVLHRTSYSKLNCWLLCPRKYRYEYVEEVDAERTPVSLIFGSAIHAAVQLWFDSFIRMPGIAPKAEPAIEEMMEVFATSIADAASLAKDFHAPLEPDCSVEELTTKAEAMLEVFLQGAEFGPKVIGTEVPFEVELAPGRIVRGYLDALLDEGNGRYRIVEVKTSGQAYGQDRLEYDHQPTVYIKAMEDMLQAPGKVDFEYWVLTKTKSPSLKIYPIVRTERDVRELIETIDDVHHAISSGVFPRQRGFMCQGCQHRDRCAL